MLDQYRRQKAVSWACFSGVQDCLDHAIAAFNSWRETPGNNKWDSGLLCCWILVVRCSKVPLFPHHVFWPSVHTQTYIILSPPTINILLFCSSDHEWNFLYFEIWLEWLIYAITFCNKKWPLALKYALICTCSLMYCYFNICYIPLHHTLASRPTSSLPCIATPLLKAGRRSGPLPGTSTFRVTWAQSGKTYSMP